MSLFATNFHVKHLPLTGAPSMISNLAIVSFSLYELEPAANKTCSQLQFKLGTLGVIDDMQ